MTIKYVYSRGGKGNDIAFAYRFDDVNKRIIYNAARCGKRDQFDKAIGRTIASERLALDRHNHPNQYASYEEMGGDRYSQIATYLRKRGVQF